MSSFHHIILGSLLALVAGCQETAEAPPLYSLERSGQVALLCREQGSGTGRDLRACPDSDDAADDGEDRRVMALITQTLRGEVAIIDLHHEEVVDMDPALPGVEFLPVGANPTGIVSTPGGVASFVGVGEPGREGIFALPTTCIAPARKGEPMRDITLWSACRLPVAPGAMAILVDPAPSTGDGPSAYRAGCPATADSDWSELAEASLGNRREDCPCNLEVEEGIAPVGRRKLVVTLPDLGQVAVFDAQAILNLPAGSFENCQPDQVIALSSTVPEAAEQAIPADLVPAEGCEAPPVRYSFGPTPSGYRSRPSGLAVDTDRLFVGDLEAPLVHVLDITDRCDIHQNPPLLPRSFDEPNRSVFTRAVAVSPRTLAGEKFLYAVDDADGSAMIFDVSDAASPRSPLVRPGTPYLPFEAPDRIRLDSPIRDLLIVNHDEPVVNPSTATAEFGTLCDPDPAAGRPGSLYRTSHDLERGASPRKLRGTFGMLALGNGQIVVVDIEDWDAACRRPVSNNPAQEGLDWRGCAPVPDVGSQFVKDGDPTVSNEAACGVVVPHRVRSGAFMLTDSDYGVHAPTLTGFPRLTAPKSGDLGSGQSRPGRMRPRMLAVPFVPKGQPGTEPQLAVGTSQYTQTGVRQNRLDFDPQSAQSNTLLLPMIEPRAYAATEDFTAIYEGPVVPERKTGQLPASSDPQLSSELLTLRDPDAWFCDQGVADDAVTRAVGAELGVADGEPLDGFVRSHTDFVQLTGAFDEEDPYFDSKAARQRCGVSDLYESCTKWFGTDEDPEATREFRIIEAYHDHLVATPRSSSDRATWIERVHCCFPSIHSYVVRAAGQWVVRGSRLLHDIVPGEELRCVRDCSPRKALMRSRVLEVTSSDPSCQEIPEGEEELPACWIGAGVPDEDPCVVADSQSGLDPALLGASLPMGCVHSTPKARFAIYRGLRASERDMTFSWTVNGGFIPLGTSLVSNSAGYNVLPQSMIHSPQMDALVVVDGASGGLSLVDLGSMMLMGEPYL